MINPLKPDFGSLPVRRCRSIEPYLLERSIRKPDVSIITPYFNTDDVFLETVDSVMDQSFQNWEWVIVDDGSTDNKAIERLQIVASKDERIHVIRQENAGPSAARNLAVSQSSAPYLCILDSDDLLEPTYIEKCLWFLESNQEFAFCNSWTVNFGDENFLWQVGFERGEDHLRANSGPPISVIRREAFTESGGFDESIRLGHEDWDLWLALAKAGHWGFTLPEYLAWYRKRNTGRFAQVMASEQRHRDFEVMIEKKYGSLRGNFPSPQKHFPQPYEDVPSGTSLRNPLSAHNSGRRVLFIFPWLVTGGADKVNLDWIELLQGADARVTVCATLESFHDWHYRFANLTPDVFILPNFLAQRDYPRFISYLIESRQVDTVIISGSSFGYLALPFLRSKFPEVAFLDICHVAEPGWQNGGHPRFAVGYQQMLDLNLVTTGELSRWMIERNADPNRIEICYTGIDVDQLVELHNPELDGLPFPGLVSGVPVITFAGRICAQKRPDVLAAIFLALKKRKIAFQAIVIGDGELRADLEGLIQKYGLAGLVHMVGSLDHSKWIQILQKTDLFLLPSAYEGISVALLESMAAGVTPVASAVGGQREVVTEGTGILIEVSSGEIESYVEHISTLLLKEKLRKAMGESARTRIRESFSRSATQNRLLQLIDRAHRLRTTAPRQILEPGFAIETANQAVEYMRLSAVANYLWGQQSRPNERSNDIPIGGLVRLLSALGETRIGSFCLRSRRARSVGRWMLALLEGKNSRSA